MLKPKPRLFVKKTKRREPNSYQENKGSLYVIFTVSDEYFFSFLDTKHEKLYRNYRIYFPECTGP